MFKAFKLYQQSIIFEFEQEKIYHEVFNIKGFIKYIPRAVVIYNNYNKYLFIINNLVFVPLWILWSLFFHPILVIFSFLKWFPQVIKAESSSLPPNIYLSLSDIKFFSYINEEEKDYPTASIIFPFHRSQSKFSTKLVDINFFSLTSVWNMTNALIYALVTPFILLFSKNRSLLLFTYSSFYWYWTYLSLIEKNIESIWLSNHYDRWLKLVDGLNNASQKIMVQHGQMEYVEISSGAVYFPVFTNKLKNINRVFVIDENSKQYFQKMIKNDFLKFSIIKSKLILSNWEKREGVRISVLILGHQNDFSFHLSLIENLSKLKNINIAYKLHPQQTLHSDVDNCWVIRESNVIPKAEVVVSYGSSLDAEIVSLLPEARILHYDFLQKFSKEEAIADIESKILELVQYIGIK
jgi:hypothetical protein